MGWFGGKDWNIIAVIYERPDLYRVNGSRAKGGSATKTRDGAKKHERTIFWAVFDQEGAFLEGEAGLGGRRLLEAQALIKLTREFPTNQSIREMLALLEKGEQKRIAGSFVWGGYPRKEAPPGQE